MMANLYYVHDPMCSWCYAFDSALKQLESWLPASITLVKIVGGLAPDSIDPMPESVVRMVQSNWRRIEKTVPDIRFNFDFWKNNQAIRSTYPSCRAVLAAKKQSALLEDKMIAQIQWAYYKNAENPSLDKTLISCARQIGLDEKLFLSDYNSEFINAQLLDQIQFSRDLGVSTYPSLCLELNHNLNILMIDYDNADDIIEKISNHSASLQSTNDSPMTLR